MFKIEMFPASYGDCLWIEYGNGEGKPHRILIDCGVIDTFKFLKKRISQLPKNQKTFDLFVISHYDNDHIDAAVKFLNAQLPDVKFDDVWFNGWKQLPSSDTLGATEAEYASALIDKQKIPLNKAFKHKAVAVPKSGSLPSFTLAGGMRITLLSPGLLQLVALRSEWEKVLHGKGMTPGDHEGALEDMSQKKKYAADMLGPSEIEVSKLAASSFKEDESVPNGSSIAFLAEFEGKSCLFAADAFPSVLKDSITRFLKKSGQEKLPVSAFKEAHHGSRHNTSKELLELICCSRYLFSTDGKRFKHPNPESVARVIQYGGPDASLYFNYRSKVNSIWDDAGLKTKYKYKTFYPSSKSPGFVLDL
jgi:beta-lactamase superfamily II metal-dependent hydrolase